jgi:transposase
MERKRRQYTAEFKAEAVKLVTEQGYSVPEAARSLGMNGNLLRIWKNKLAGRDSQGTTLTEGEQMELRRLREENRRLRMERDILKKAAAFFANERN